MYQLRTFNVDLQLLNGFCQCLNLFGCLQEEIAVAGFLGLKGFQGLARSGKINNGNQVLSKIKFRKSLSLFFLLCQLVAHPSDGSIPGLNLLLGGLNLLLQSQSLRVELSTALLKDKEPKIIIL